MAQNNQVYVRLQKHLDKQVVGFPATRSGVETKLLKHIFPAEEPGITCCLSSSISPWKQFFIAPANCWLTRCVPVI